MFTIAIEMTTTIRFGSRHRYGEKSRLRFWLFRIVSSFDSWYDAGLSYLSPLLLFSFFLSQLSFFFLFLLCLFSTRDDAPCQKGSFLVPFLFLLVEPPVMNFEASERMDDAQHRGLDVTRGAGAARRIPKHYLLRIRCSTRAQLRNSLKANRHEI